MEHEAEYFPIEMNNTWSCTSTASVDLNPHVHLLPSLIMRGVLPSLQLYTCTLMTRYLDELACTRASGSGFVWLGADRNGAPGSVFITARTSIRHRGKQRVKQKSLCDMYTCVCIYI